MSMRVTVTDDAGVERFNYHTNKDTVVEALETCASHMAGRSPTYQLQPNHRVMQVGDRLTIEPIVHAETKKK